MAGGRGSAFHWYGTFALLLVPGTRASARLIGLAEHRRRTGGSRSPMAHPVPVSVPCRAGRPDDLQDAVSPTGIGGGSIGVVLFGLAGGYALSGRGRAWWRRTCGAFAVLGMLLMLVMASDTAPLATAHGAWVGLYAASLIAALCLACAIPQRIGRPCLVPTRVDRGSRSGRLCGFAWAAALRAFMWEVAGPDAGVEWTGTFLWVLLPGAVIGALLAWAEHRRWTGTRADIGAGSSGRPCCSRPSSLHNPRDLADGFEGGVGLAAVAVPAMCMLGGYAIAGRGPRWVRGLCGLVTLSAIPIWSLTATDVGGSSMSLGDPHGAWAAVLYWGLLATFSLAAAIPHRRPVPPFNRPSRPPAPSSQSAPTTTT